MCVYVFMSMCVAHCGGWGRVGRRGQWWGIFFSFFVCVTFYIFVATVFRIATKAEYQAAGFQAAGNRMQYVLGL